MVRPRLRLFLHLGFAAIGVGAISFIAYTTGFERLWGAVAVVAWWFPLVLALEGARIGADTWATWLLYGERRNGLSPLRLLRATLMTYVAVLLLPAGRFGGEAFKAAMLRHDVGIERAAASAVFLQAFPLLCGAVISIPCVAVAFSVWGAHWLSWAVLAQALTAFAAGAAFIVAGQVRGVGRIVERASVRLGAATSRVQAEVRSMGWLPRKPFLVGLLGRALFGAQLVVLAHAVEVPRGFWGGLLTFGVHLVGSALGDLVPAQLGATDGVLVLAADDLGAPVAALVAAAFVFHASQLAWAGIGAITALRAT